MFNRIKDLREDSDLTQTQLASYLHLSQRGYSHYESGSRKIPLDFLIALADFYNVSIDYLLGRTDIKEINKWKRSAAQTNKFCNMNLAYLSDTPLLSILLFTQIRISY